MDREAGPGGSGSLIGAGLGVLAFAVILGLSQGVSIAGEGSEAAPRGPHAPLTLVEGRLQVGTGEAADEITDVTGYCSSCHEEATEGIPATPHSEGSSAGNHPVEVTYPEDDREYRAREELAPSLLLLGGRMTCVTCHAHDSQDHALVLTTDDSELCRACHLT